MGAVLFSGCRQMEEAPACFHEDWVCKSCACIEIYAPVCGCNNVTYGNECHARIEGYEVKHEGECGK